MKIPATMNDKILTLFKREQAMFMKNGHPISFGRMEGIKDVLEILNDHETLIEVQRLINQHIKEMSKQCS